jgi:two-component system chemotaxis response regulator CheY
MLKILVADDARFTRNRLVNLLTENGYAVVEVENGEQAVETYRTTNPDAVLMDFAMPGKNGLAAMTEIRKFDPQAKVIFLTALDQQAIALRAVQAGAKDFLIKPCEPKHLLAALQKVLERAR